MDLSTESCMKILYDSVNGGYVSSTIYRIIQSKPTACTTPRVSPKINCGPWVTTMHKYGFINCNKRSTLVGVFTHTLVGEGHTLHFLSNLL